MRARIMTTVAPIAAIAALAAGGVAYASNGNSTAQHTKAKTMATTEQAQSGPDTDNIQSGDQTTPDTGPSAEQDSETSGESGSTNDGAGGHADAPGNVDHRFQGQE